MLKYWVFLALVFSSVSSYAQIYRAGQGAFPEPINFPRFEISVGTGFTSASLQEPSGDTVIHDKNVTDLRLLYALSSWFSVGPAVYVSRRKENQPLVSSYKTRRAGIIGKFNLSPDTTPRSYALIEAGAMERKLSYMRTLEDSAASLYVTAGLGTEVDICSGFFLGLEGRVTRYFKDKIGPYIQLNSPWEVACSLRAGIRF